MLFIGSVILLFLALAAAFFRRFKIPMIILALAVGIFFGSDVTGVIYFDDALLTRKLADIVLVFVLFAGGFSIKRADLAPIFAPTMSLASLGVLLTAIVTAVAFYFFSGWPFEKALLVSAAISSTDAAAVFSILRGKSIQTRPASITEIESAANDPMAIISTTFVIDLIAAGSTQVGRALLMFSWQLAGGILIGLAIGYIGALLLRRIREVETGYYYIFLIGLTLASYSAADFLGASGILAAFFAGYSLGNSKLPNRTVVSSFIATTSFVANAGLFILLGLLVFPKSLGEVWLQGLLMFAVISFIGRPLAVFICTAPFKIPFKEKIFLSWSGIRGSVPIVLATYPAAAGLDPDNKIFNIVFFAVTLSILFQGTTIGKLAEFLGLLAKKKPSNAQRMELVTVHDTKYELAEIFIDESLYEGETRLADIHLSPDTTITMISRKNRILAARGATLIRPGDILTVLAEEDKIETVTAKVFAAFKKI